MRRRFGIGDTLRTLCLGIGLAALLASPLAARSAHAQESATGSPAAAQLLKVSAAPVVVTAGSRAEVVVHLSLAKGWHVNANPPALDYNIPTEVSLTAAHGITAGAPSYPAGQKEKFEFEDTPLLVYTDAADVRVPITVAANATSGTLQGKVRFQACDNQVCLAPSSVDFKVQVTVTGGAAVATSESAAAPESVAVTEATPPAKSTSTM